MVLAYLGETQDSNERLGTKLLEREKGLEPIHLRFPSRERRSTAELLPLSGRVYPVGKRFSRQMDKHHLDKLARLWYNWLRIQGGDADEVSSSVISDA